MCTFQYWKVHSFCVCCYEEGRYNVVSQPNFITPFLMCPHPCRGRERVCVKPSNVHAFPLPLCIGLCRSNSHSRDQVWLAQSIGVSVQGQIGHGWNWRRMTMERQVDDGGDLTLLRFVWCGDQGLVFGSCRQAEFVSKQA